MAPTERGTPKSADKEGRGDKVRQTIPMTSRAKTGPETEVTGGRRRGRRGRASVSTESGCRTPDGADSRSRHGRGKWVDR